MDTELREFAPPELERINRALRMLSESNQTLLRVADETAMIQEMCRIAVEIGGHRTAWIGLSESDVMTVRRVAQKGEPLTVDGDAVERALRTQLPCVLRGDPAASCIALPLTGERGTLGVLCIHSDVAGAFDDEEVNVLAELAADVAFGIDAARTRAERDRATAALTKREELYRSLIDAMTEGVLYQDALGHITAANPAALRITGRTETELLGQTFEHLQAGAVREDGSPFPGQEQPSMVSLRTGQPQSDVIMGIRRSDGSHTWISVNAQPLIAAPGQKPYAVVTTLHDVTDRKRMQDALAARDQELRSLAHSSPGLMGTYYQRPDGSVCMPYTSPRIWDLFGVRSQDVAQDATPLLQRTHPDDAVRVAETIAESARTMTRWHLEYRVLHPTRGEIWLEGSSNPEPHPGGGVVWYGFVHDVTARKRAQHELALTRFALDHVREAAYLVDEKGRFVYVNDESCHALGYSRDELIGLSVPDIDPNFTQAQWGERRKQGLQATSLQTCHRRKDGQIFPVEIYSNYFEYDGRRYVLSLARDISERVRAEEALRESEQRFRQVTENIDEVFWLTNVANSELMYVSPAYSAIWGRSCESLYAAPRSWLDAIHADDRERIRAALAEHVPEGRYDVEYRIVRPDGSLRWIHDRAFPIRDATGSVYRIAGVAEDITTRRDLEEQFRQSQKMEAVGQLAGGIAHDFNNILAVIQMNTSMLLDDPAASAHAVAEGLAGIHDAAERAANLTRQLLTFSRRELKRARNLQLGEIIDSMTRMLRRVLGEDISLETRFAPDLPAVYADRSMMEQVLMNLALNARDAMPRGGRLTVALETVTVHEAHAGGRTDITPGRFVCLTVADTGGGIAPENRSRIFEPFFTTKEVGKGTGLGLATVFAIVRQHRGWIEVDSELGKGATFRAYLPALDTAAAQGAESASVGTVARGSETILLVEDDENVRRLTSLVLGRQGYRVLEAPNAVVALALWETKNTHVDLLLTDMVMPGGVSGRELAAALVARQPELKVVYTSGYSADLATDGLSWVPGRNYLEKPYSALTLAECVRRCLHGD